MENKLLYVSTTAATDGLGGGGTIPPEGAESLLLGGRGASRRLDGGGTNQVAPRAIQNDPSLEEQTKGKQQPGQENGTPADTNQPNARMHGNDDREDDAATVLTTN